MTDQVANGHLSVFENDIHWALFYLAKTGLVARPKRGLWQLTAAGQDKKLTLDKVYSLYERARKNGRQGSLVDEGILPAPDDDDDGDDKSYWFVGAVWDGKDQLSRFLQRGIWENGYDDKFSDLVRRIKAGDRIAIKSGFVQKHQLPFDVGGKSAAAMRIKATGIVIENNNDGKSVTVAWDPAEQPRDWYFYTYRTTIVETDVNDAHGARLIDFAFRRIPQDYHWFLARPYWVKKYGAQPLAPVDDPGADVAGTLMDVLDGDEEIFEDSPYTVDDIIAEGCFLASDTLHEMLDGWRRKKNIILQGPPGTGKTWLAKRLGFALAGSRDRETERSRLRVVHFHPSLAYEDFVRGWRPAGDGRLALVDGVLMQAIEAASSEPDRPFVLVIEEINRGNPAQIFGEMLTLLESSKRRPAEAIELTYRDPENPGERVHVPDNLFIIGTMNVADRSLAIVDLALRRRFAFFTLQPMLGEAWSVWCAARGLDQTISVHIKLRMTALNAEIAAALALGPQFQIGHSYVTPDMDENVRDGWAWFRTRVEAEIGPLLDEYWYDQPDLADAARRKLLQQPA